MGSRIIFTGAISGRILPSLGDLLLAAVRQFFLMLSHAGTYSPTAGLNAGAEFLNIGCARCAHFIVRFWRGRGWRLNRDRGLCHSGKA